jgi:O-antigen ligase
MRSMVRAALNSIGQVYAIGSWRSPAFVSSGSSIHIQNHQVAIALAGWVSVFVPIALVVGNAGAEISICIVVIIFLANCIGQRQLAWAKEDWALAVLALWAYGCVRAIFAAHVLESLIQAVIWIRFPLFAVALANWILVHAEWRRRLMYSTVAAAAFLAADAVLQYFVGTDIIGRPTWGNRLTATFAAPKVGITIAWIFIPAMLGLLHERGRIISLLFGGLCFVAILLSGDRMAVIFSLLCLTLLYPLLGTYRKQALIGLSALALLTATALHLKPEVYDRQVRSTISAIENVSDTHYGVIWTSAMRMVRDYPLFGVGMANYRMVCADSHYGPERNEATGFERCSTHPHNIYIEWLVETGFIGLSGFILCGFLILRRLFKALLVFRHQQAFLGLLITVAVRLWPLSTSTDFFHAWAAVPFWLVVGWGLSFPTSQEGVRLAPFRSTQHSSG